MVVVLRGVILIAFATLGFTQNATNITSVFPPSNSSRLNASSVIPAKNATNATLTPSTSSNNTFQGTYEVTTELLNATRLNLTDLSIIKNNTKLVIIIPCLDFFESAAYKKLVDAYKNAKNYTVIKMIWNEVANYSDSDLERTKIAGHQLGNLIQALQKNGVKERNIHLIGSHEGSIVASIAAKLIPTNSSGRIGRFTALNPPGQSLWRKIVSIFIDDYGLELSPTDADIYDTLHTVNGYSSSGGVDFYANKGKVQPGCYDELSCYLDRAIEIMAESVQSNKFVAQKCTYGFFRGWVCTRSGSVIFGENMTKGIFEGTYNFYTNSVPPYALN